jgi:hypothetical protein
MDRSYTTGGIVKGAHLASAQQDVVRRTVTLAAMRRVLTWIGLAFAIVAVVWVITSMLASA